MAMYKEFDAGRQINSPHIVKYVGINEDEQGLYVLMEHINGMSMAEKMETEPAYFRNQRNTVKMLKQLLEALKALHSKNIAYLDLKPENIMLTQISNDVKLTDLGGCFADSNDYTAESTHKYAAPELIEERLDDVDARTDIYGIGNSTAATASRMFTITQLSHRWFPSFLTAKTSTSMCLPPL